MSPPPRSWLYVPADRPEWFGKALRSGADAIVLDLEDSVRPGQRDQARRAIGDWASQQDLRNVFVRISSPGSAGGRRDLDAVAGLGLAGLRVAKAETARHVAEVGQALDAAGVATAVYPLLESARGLASVRELLAAHPRVAGVCLGESDLRADLGISDEGVLDWIRTLVVVSARAAGLPSPPMSVYGKALDDDGLRADCERGRRRGFFGRSAIHPRQVPVINQAFRPSADDIAWARRVTGAWNSRAAEHGALLVDGVLVDASGVRRAESILGLADRDRKEGQ
jgi:citrate lyase subunit beta / citryl-CoA lyase